MDGDLIEIVDEYDKDGVLVNRYVDGLQIPFPRGENPSVTFLDIQPKWAFQRTFMTRAEVKEIYGKKSESKKVR